MANFIGSSSTLVGAAYETAGYYYQSYLLDVFSSPFGSSVGALFYLIGILIVLFSILLKGHHNFSPWLLLGPALFFSSVFIRTPTKGANWKFAGEQRNAKSLQETVEAALPNIQTASPAQISYLFSWYNELVSSTIQQTVRVLNARRKNTDLKFLIWAQLYGNTISAELKDPAFRELLHKALLGQCQELLQSGREMADVTNPSEKRCKAAQTYYPLAFRPQQLSSQAVQYVASLKVDFPEIFEMQIISSPYDEVQKALETLERGPGGECTVDGMKYDGKNRKYVQEYMDKVNKQEDAIRARIQQSLGKDGGIRNSADANAVRASAPDRQAKIAIEAGKISQELHTCHDVWRFVYGGLHIQALRTVKSVVERGAAQGVPGDELRQELQALTRQQSMDGVYQAIARRIFQNEYHSSITAGLATRYEHRAKETPEFILPEQSKLRETESIRRESIRLQEKTRLMSVALSLPYYQGLGLYFLSLAFPFAALLLLVPGQHGGFFTWFMLWFWLKSWDIGYAVVMLLDDILYSLFVTALNKQTGAAANQLSADLAIATLSMRENDPTFHLTTYYNIIGIALMSISPLTSHFFLKSFRGAAGLIADGVSRAFGIAGWQFGGGGGLGYNSRSAQQQEGVNAWAREALNAQQARLHHYLAAENGNSSGFGFPRGEENHVQNSGNPGGALPGSGSGGPNSGLSIQQSTAIAKTAAYTQGIFQGIARGNDGTVGAIASGLQGFAATTQQSAEQYRDIRLALLQQEADVDGITVEALDYQELSRNRDGMEIPETSTAKLFGSGQVVAQSMLPMSVPLNYTDSAGRSLQRVLPSPLVFAAPAGQAIVQSKIFSGNKHSPATTFNQSVEVVSPQERAEMYRIANSPAERQARLRAQIEQAEKQQKAAQQTPQKP